MLPQLRRRDTTSGGTVIIPQKKENHTILVIDRSGSLLELMERWLLDLGNIEVVTTKYFDEGVEHIRSDKPTSMVIADYCEKKDRNGLWFLKGVSIHSPKTIRYLTTCCLDESELENHKIKGILHYFSKTPFMNTDITDNIKLGLGLYEKKLSIPPSIKGQTMRTVEY
jgi:DNA-binding NtrC family response regulator